MKISRFILPILALSLVVSCNPLKEVNTAQSSVSDAYAAGDYQQTLATYERLNNLRTSKGGAPDLAYVKMAAKAAVELERYQQAEELLNEWLDRSEDQEAILLLGDLYKRTRQIENEQAHWDKYLDRVKSEELKRDILSRQFALEVDKKNYEKALALWDEMPPTFLPDLMYKRAEALKATGKVEEANQVVDDILERNPNHEGSLLWRASNIYTDAEKWYQSEMSKYNKKADYTSYVYLRRELKKISSMFRQSKDMFEKLHEIDPANKTYIKYLKNIYLRLEMKEEAVKMDMLLES